MRKVISKKVTDIGNKKVTISIKKFNDVEIINVDVEIIFNRNLTTDMVTSRKVTSRYINERYTDIVLSQSEVTNGGIGKWE